MLLRPDFLSTGGVQGDPSITEAQRNIGNIIRYGTVLEVDCAKLVCRVGTIYEDGEPLIETDWIPYATGRAGDNQTWFPPNVGENVILLAPGGELENAVALLATWGDEVKIPESDRRETLHRVHYKDGLEVEYDQQSHTLRIDAREVPDAKLEVRGTLRIHLEGYEQIILEGNVVVTGNLYVGGQMIGHGRDSALPLVLQGNPIHLNPGTDWTPPPDWPYNILSGD